MGDRSITFVFVAVWVGVGAVWIILDWLGNPSRGSFRPTGRRIPRNLRARWTDRQRHRAEEDAAVRATLRERYGRSSLRLFWSDDRESKAQDADSRLVSDPLLASAPPEPELRYAPLLLDEEFVEPTSEPDPEPELDIEAEAEPEIDPTTIRGWKVSVHPLALTRTGAAPRAATIRTRVWKNLAAADPSAAPDTLRRMAAGKPPQRTAQRTGKSETAKVNLDSALPYWPGETTDSFSLS